MEWIRASSGRERVQRESTEKESESRERDRERVLIERGRGGWSEGIENFFRVRGHQVAEILRGEAII